MPEITSFEQAEAVLMRYMPLSKKMTGRNLTLERMIPMMKVLGNPEQKLKAIHIAGTSGKTSVAYYITALLYMAGKKTGTTVSPHIDSVAERVQINGRPLEEKEFCSALTEFLEIINGVEISPTYFELMIAFAFWYFVKAQVDYAVAETGLGGLHDSTNILQRADKICVITDIGYDHMEILGDSLKEIATQKAGIIHPGNQVFMYSQSEEINKVIKDQSKKSNAQLEIFNKSLEQSRDEILQETSGLPPYQQSNWVLANNVYKYLYDRDDLIFLTETDLTKSASINIPARMDQRTHLGKTIIMDGAHNAQKMQAFVGSIRKMFPGKRAAILLSLKSGKSFTDIIPILSEISTKLIITKFSTFQDMPAISADLDKLSQTAKPYFKVVEVIEDQDKAYDELINQDEELLCITGSFYLISQLRRKHQELQDHRG